MRYSVTHSAFDGSPASGPGFQVDVDDDQVHDTLADAVRGFGCGQDPDDQEYLTLTQADDRARPIGDWLVSAVQAAGQHGRFTLEFIAEDAGGDPRRHRALQLARPQTLVHDPENPDLFDRNAVACLLHCFVEQRDLSHLFTLFEVWTGDDSEHSADDQA